MIADPNRWRVLVVFGRKAPELGTTTEIDGRTYVLVGVVCVSREWSGIYEPLRGEEQE